jgi:TetR/AcrR family transcriptional regulator, regulator of cefoperazone and chloramphenicol sensitivity
MTKVLNKNTEQKIIDVATELFAKNGFEGASIREICKQAGVNISLISYYFGSKEGLYKKIIDNIALNIISHAQGAMGFHESPESFDNLTKDEKIGLLFKLMEMIIDYFYSDNISTEALMILFREQITSNVELNPFGYKIFKRLLASILDKDENDKEVIFRCVSIVGQMNSARILTQFSLKFLNQDKFTSEDIQLVKNIAISQTKAILKDLGGMNE